MSIHIYHPKNPHCGRTVVGLSYEKGDGRQGFMLGPDDAVRFGTELIKAGAAAKIKSMDAGYFGADAGVEITYSAQPVLVENA